MKSLLIVFFVVILAVLLLIFPFKLRMAGHVNFIELKAFYCFKIWRFKFLCGKAYVEPGGSIKIENSNNMFSSDMDKQFMSILGKILLDKIDLKKMEIFFSGGFEENSYSSAIVCGSVTSVVRSAYSMLSQKFKNVKMYEDITPSFFETNLELTYDAVISISILKIFISLIKANIKTKKIKGE